MKLSAAEPNPYLMALLVQDSKMLYHLIAILVFIFIYERLPYRGPGRTMSIVYAIDHKKGITYVLWEGVIKPGEVQAHIERLHADPEWPPPGRLQLVDLRSLVGGDRTEPEKLKEAAGLFGERPEKIKKMKMAFVASDAFTKSTLFQGFMEAYPISVIVFNGLDTACLWLGINATEAGCVMDELRSKAKSGHAGKVTLKP
jgi:hypothetical protein